MSRSAVYVPSTLPANWWHDEFMRDQVHNDIRTRLRDGTSLRETARLTGASDQTVKRMAKRMKERA